MKKVIWIGVLLLVVVNVFAWSNHLSSFYEQTNPFSVPFNIDPTTYFINFPIYAEVYNISTDETLYFNETTGLKQGGSTSGVTLLYGLNISPTRDIYIETVYTHQHHTIDNPPLPRGYIFNFSSSEFIANITPETNNATWHFNTLLLSDYTYFIVFGNDSASYETRNDPAVVPLNGTHYNIYGFVGLDSQTGSIDDWGRDRTYIIQNISYNLSVPNSYDVTPFNNQLSEGCICPNCTISENDCILPINVSAGAKVVNLTNATYIFGVDNCTDSIGLSTNATILNFTIYNETNLADLNARVEGVLVYDIYNYTFNYPSVHSFQLCGYPWWINISVNVSLEYEPGGGYNMRYYLVHPYLNNKTQDAFLYNFDSTAGISELTAIIKDTSYEPLTDHIIKMQRYYPGEYLWRTVQIDKSDEFGKGILYVIQNEEDYKFIFEKNGVEIDRTSNVHFSCDSDTECTQEFILFGFDEGTEWEGMTGGIDYNNITNMVSFTWSDPNGIASTVRLLVEKQATDKVITICNQEATSSSGTMNCNISGYSGIVTAKGYRASSPEVPWLQKVIEIFSGKLHTVLSSNTGMFLSTFLMIGIVSFGVATGSALVTILIGVGGLVFMYLFSMTNLITITVVISGVAVGILLAFLVKK